MKGKYSLLIIMVVALLATSIFAIQTVSAASSYIMTVSYSLAGTPTGSPSAPVLDWGSTYQNHYTISNVATPKDLGKGVNWRVTNPLSPSSSTERWYSVNSPLSGTTPSSGGADTYVFNYMHQYYLTFNYQVSGGGSGYSAPTVSYFQNGGTAKTVTAGSSASVWVDAGSTYTYTNNPLGGSTSSQRWEAISSSLTGTVTSSTTYNPTYYRQYLQTLSYSKDSGNPTAPSFTAIQLGYLYGQAIPTSATGYWFDYSTSTTAYSVTNPLGSGNERWYTSATTSGSITSAQTLAFAYNHQYQVTFAQSGLDSSATGTVVTVNSATKVYADLSFNLWVNSGGSVTYTFNNPLSSSTTKQQFRLTGATGSTSPITVSSGATITGNYLVQYQHTVTSSPATGSGFITVDGGAQTTPYTTPYWDSGSSHTIVASSSKTLVLGQSQYAFSSWSDSGAQSHSVSPATITTYTANFHTQYKVSFDASSNVKGDSSSTVVTVSGVAKSASALPFTTDWLTSGVDSITYSYSSPVASSTDSVGRRYIWSSTNGLSQTLQGNTFIVNSAGTVTGIYTFQAKVGIAQTGLDSSATGTVVTINGSPKTFVDMDQSVWVSTGDSLTYTFTNPVTSSTNGKQFKLAGVSGDSSPIVSPSSAITVLATYVPLYHTNLDITCTPAEVNPSAGTTKTTVTATLTTDDGTLLSGKIVTLYYFDATLPPADRWVLLGSGSTVDGKFSVKDWVVPQTIAVGPEPLKAVFGGVDSGSPQYQSCEIAKEGGNASLVVVPEYIFGALAAVGACFVGFVAFKKRSILPHFKRV